MKTPIESVLALKRWEEDEAKNLFAIASRELTEEEDRLAALENNFMQLSEIARANEKVAVTIEELQRQQLHLDHIVSLVQRQREMVEMRQRRLEDAERIMTGASTERKIYERVDDKHKEALELDEKRRQERVIDEHAVNRYKKNFNL